MFQFLVLINIHFLFLSAVFKLDELRYALRPTLETLYRQDPESVPFRTPVDPVKLSIPVSVCTNMAAIKLLANVLKNCFANIFSIIYSLHFLQIRVLT